MTIQVDDFDPEFGALLFSRAAWRLPAGARLPDRLVVTPPTTPGPGFDEDLVYDWESSWARHCAHVGDFDDFDVDGRGLDELFASIRSRDQRLPQPWQDRMRHGLGDSFDQWSEAVRRSVRTGVRPAIVTSFEGAWRMGLTHFSVVPFGVEHFERLTRRRAMVSVATWNDDALMRRALGAMSKAA